MAKFDTSKIEGFEGMSVEDKLNAVLGFELEEPAPAPNTAEVDRLKQALNKANGEAANFKNQLRAKQTEQERLDAERQEAEQKLKDELDNLRREKTVTGYKNKFLEAGFSAELAETSAAALADGNTEQMFADLAAYINEKTKAIEAEALNKQPPLTPGTPPSAQTVEQKRIADFRKAAMGY